MTPTDSKFRPLFRRATQALALCALVVLSVSPASAKKGDTSGKLTTFTVTVDGAEVGIEKARLVTTDAGTFFASGERHIKKGKGKIHLKSHLQRGKDGNLQKYRRLKAGRKGAGVFGFARNGVLRVVGLNTKREASEHNGVFSKKIWDGTVLNTLASWTPALRGKTDAVHVAFFDIETTKTGEATLTRSDDVKVGGKDSVVTLAAWTVSGTPGPQLTVLVDDRGRLVGVKAPKQAMLKKGWSWDPSSVVAEEPKEPEEDVAPADSDDEKELAP
ncbi:MAG: hypothetical protein ACI9MR_003122 [Myxococcota bacterium]|jgi:hypothetical protein